MVPPERARADDCDGNEVVSCQLPVASGGMYNDCDCLKLRVALSGQLSVASGRMYNDCDRLKLQVALSVEPR